MSIGPFLRDVVHLDRSRLAPGVALAGALGFAIPLALGLLTGHVSDGVVAAAGALIVGFANLGDSYPQRAATLSATTAASSLAALLGVLAADSVVAGTVLIGAWGFLGGLLVAFGARLAFVGMLSTWALLLGGDLGLHGGSAAHETLLIAGGGLLQTTVALLAWPLRPDAVERRAVAAAYRALARYARDPTPAQLRRSGAALAEAAEAVGAGTAAGSRRGAARALAEQGEWIRLEIAALAHATDPASRPAREDEDAGRRDDEPSAVLLDLAAAALEEIASSLDHAGPADARASVSRLREEAAAVGPDEPARAASALASWIEAAAERRRIGLALDPWSPRSAVADAIDLLRRQLTTGSPAFRHATRLAFALMVAFLAYRSLDLGFGYWVPLTVLFVLKPDHGTTFSRGVGRAAGTMAGIVLAWSMLTLSTPTDGAIVILLSLLALAAYALYPVNYALFSIVLTVLVALLAEFGGGSAIGALESRLLDTAIGAAIALGAFTIWPTPEGPHLNESLATLVDTQRRWLDAVLGTLARSEAYEPRRLRAHRLRTRAARGDAGAALERALAEPIRRRPDPRLPRAVLVASDRIGESTLVMAASLHGGVRFEEGSSLGAFEQELGGRLEELSRSVRTGTWTSLDPTHAEVLALDQESLRGREGAGAPDPVILGEARLLSSALRELDSVAMGLRRPGAEETRSA